MVQERRLYSQELHDLQFSSNIITMVMDKMGGACGTNRTGGKCITNFSGKSDRLRPPEVLGAYVKMINVYYRKGVNGLFWLRIGFSSGMVWRCSFIHGDIKNHRRHGDITLKTKMIFCSRSLLAVS